MKSPKILASAKGKDCTFRIPGICNRNPETTVACHGPDPKRGKSMKAPDYWIAYGCSDCHAAMDNRNVEDWESYWLQGIRETQKLLAGNGLIVLPVKETKPKKLTKIAQVKRRSLYG